MSRIRVIVGDITDLDVDVVVNAANFYDGMDGLLSLTAVGALGVWAAVAFTLGEDGLTFLLFTAILIGFLPRNWSVARIFLGDGGRSAELVTIHRAGQQDQTRPADAILIPGSGVNYDGSPSPNFLARIEHGRWLYEAGYAPLIALTGGSRREELREEARVAEEILLARGVPPEAILVEDRSQNTAENMAYIAPLLRERGVESILLVTSPFHQWRAERVFEEAGFEVYLSPPPDDPAELRPVRRPYYLARMIPLRGSWLDFEFDSSDNLYVRIDKKKKLPVTVFLQALGIPRDKVIKNFYDSDVIYARKGDFFRKLDQNLVGQRVEKGMLPEKHEKRRRSLRRQQTIL